MGKKTTKAEMEARRQLPRMAWAIADYYKSWPSYGTMLRDVARRLARGGGSEALAEAYGRLLWMRIINATRLVDRQNARTCAEVDRRYHKGIKELGKAMRGTDGLSRTARLIWLIERQDVPSSGVIKNRPQKGGKS